jgi:hypothetical protein
MSDKVDPVTKAMSITPHDTNTFTDEHSPNGAIMSRGVSVNVAGVLKFKDSSGNVRTTGTLAAGVIHPIETNVIMATGTTATGIYIYW